MSGVTDGQISSTENKQTVLHVLPRGMRFSRSSATSIDLFVHEMAAQSRFHVEIAAETPGDSLPTAHLHELPNYDFATTFRRARYVADIVRRLDPRLVIVQQHLPSAASIAAQVRAPVLLQRHNFMRPPKRTPILGALSRARHVRQLNSLDGLTFVSETVLSEFEQDWPEVDTPRRAIPNAIDFSIWTPAKSRQSLILIVGRATPEKGLVQAAQALRSVLPERPDWRATFVVSESDRNPSYFAELSHVTRTLGPQVEIRTNRPFAEVKSLNEIASIALIPSRWREPFGRTCLEAHAGGAAVISSGSGGLREISDSCAIYAAPEGREMAAAIARLIDNPQLRQELQEGGRSRALRMFGLPKVAGLLDDFCAEIMAAGKRR